MSMYQSMTGRNEQEAKKTQLKNNDLVQKFGIMIRPMIYHDGMFLCSNKDYSFPQIDWFPTDGEIHGFISAKLYEFFRIDLPAARIFPATWEQQSGKLHLFLHCPSLTPIVLNDQLQKSFCLRSIDKIYGIPFDPPPISATKEKGTV